MHRTVRRVFASALLITSPTSYASEMPTREIPQEFLRSVPTLESSDAPGRERPQVFLNGVDISVLAPLYEHSSGNISYIRFFNDSTTTSVITVQVIGTPTGRVYGSAAITVPSHASPQFAYTQILERAAVALAAYVGGDNGFSFYLSAGTTAQQSYQHVIHSTSSGFFENMSVCQWDEVPSEGLASAGLINVHTTSPYMVEYPSQIAFHHYGGANATYRARIYRSTDGTLMDTFTFPMRPKETFVADSKWYQDSWIPADVESHMNIVFSRSDGGTFEGIPAHLVANGRVNGFVNMTQFCQIGYTQPVSPG